MFKTVIFHLPECDNLKQFPHIQPLLNDLRKYNISYVTYTNLEGYHKDNCILFTYSEELATLSKEKNIVTIGYMRDSETFILNTIQLLDSFKDVRIAYLKEAYLRGHNLPITIATTKRLIIRELSMKDFDSYYNLYQSDMVTSYIKPLKDKKTECEKLECYIKNIYNFYGYGLWGVFLKETNTLIGQCGIESKNNIELGFVLDYNHWGYGYGIESVTAVLNYAFKQLEFHKIHAIVHIKNDRSIHLLEKVGFQRISEFILETNPCYIYEIMNYKLNKYKQASAKALDTFKTAPEKTVYTKRFRYRERKNNERNL